MAATHLPYPPIPYGMADFSAIRREGFLYVDKTRFLRDLENERHVFLLRPRRFGKSCWISILEHYYDRRRKDNFEALFAGTDIGREPTPATSPTSVWRNNTRRCGSPESPWCSAAGNWWRGRPLMAGAMDRYRRWYSATLLEP